MNNYVSPTRQEEEGALLYTEAEGGEYKLIGDYTPEMFAQVVERGWFEYRPGDYWIRIYPAYAAYMKILGGWDFVLQALNEGRRFQARSEEYDRHGNLVTRGINWGTSFVTGSIASLSSRHYTYDEVRI